jgi:hypothetical protein
MNIAFSSTVSVCMMLMLHDMCKKRSSPVVGYLCGSLLVLTITILDGVAYFLAPAHFSKMGPD